MPKMKRRPSRRNIVFFIVIAVLLAASFFLDKTFVHIMTAVQAKPLVIFFYYYTMLGEIYIFGIISAILLAALLINRKKISAFVLALASSAFISLLLKTLINRPRPFEVLNVEHAITTSTSSFPSGHTIMFFCMIPVMSKSFPKLRYVFWSFAILMALSRMYLGVHYFSDVLWGSALGYAIGWMFMRLGERYGWKY